MTEMRERERIPLAPGVRLDWRAPTALPTIETDEPKLRSVLDNLVNNAINFTVRGSITVSLDVLPGATGVQLAVDDTGPGISASDLPRILEPFHQGEPAPNGAHHGVGLGLAIVDRYVALPGGKLEVFSRVGIGTTFLVSLPLALNDTTSPVAPPLQAA